MIGKERANEEDCDTGHGSGIIPGGDGMRECRPKWDGKEADYIFDAFLVWVAIFMILRGCIPTGFYLKLGEVSGFWETG